MDSCWGWSQPNSLHSKPYRLDRRGAGIDDQKTIAELAAGNTGAAPVLKIAREREYTETLAPHIVFIDTHQPFIMEMSRNANGAAMLFNKSQMLPEFVDCFIEIGTQAMEIGVDKMGEKDL